MTAEALVGWGFRYINVTRLKSRVIFPASTEPIHNH